ncbi:MAG: OmpP1/FadL family transporter [Pirellulaceae bacterium]
MRSFPLVARLLLVTAVLSTATASADGLIRDGQGAISMGRGGVNLGYADNGAIIIDNPAGMGNVSGTGLADVSLDTVICSLKYTDSDNLNPDSSTNGYPLASIGYICRNPDSPWTWGIGAFAPAGFGAGYDLVNPHTGPSSYKSFGALVKILPSLAYQVNERLVVGGSFGLALSHVQLEGPFYIQTGPFAGTPTLLHLQGTGVAPTGIVGLQYKLTPDTVLGLSYTEQTRFDFDGNASAQIISPFGPLSSAFDARTSIKWPRSLGIGLMHQFCSCSRVGFDVVWYDWSSAFDQLPITLSNSSNPVVGGLLGPQYQDSFPMNWHDSVSYRFGYEWSPTDDFTGRMGYVYHRSPVPDATLNPYLDGILEHVVTVGGSRRVGSSWINFAYQYSWSPTRTVGTSSIVGGDFSNSSLNAQAHWFSLSVLRNF